jgi:oligo-1,6-glucosidase
MASSNPGKDHQTWWKESVIYQIYPASFKDSNRDGWGDITGITSKLDYLKDLGVDIIWLSPIYKSPKADMGYDISDYEDIDPTYGTLSDVDHLISELKKRDMKLMMDLVVNHTSNEHPWFLESKSSKSSPKRDWYIWKPAKFNEKGERVPPNNWSQLLGEINCAWTWDEGSQEYYLSLFTPEQPDLNWENPAVRAAVHSVLRFWLDRGASGFRMDVINLISKNQAFPDGAVIAPDHVYQPGDKFFANGPRLHEYLREINDKVLSHYDTITVGEMPFVRDEGEIMRIVHPDRNELNMIFIFEIVDVDNVPGQYRMTEHRWKRSAIRRVMARWQRLMADKGGWNSLFIENHDNPRSVSRYVSDSDKHRALGAKLLALMMTTSKGTLYIYQGQELGQRNVPLDWDVTEYKDIESINYWKKMGAMYRGTPQEEEKMAEAKRILQLKARDHSRTPVQWTAESPNAGFTDKDVKPWMRVNDDYPSVNAEAQMSERLDGNLSVRQFWKRGLASRKEHKEAFVYGDFELLGDGDDEDDPVFAYKRVGKDSAWVVVLNFSEGERKWMVSENVEVKQWVAGNYVPGKVEKPLSEELVLQPWEGILGRC